MMFSRLMMIACIVMSSLIPLCGCDFVTEQIDAQEIAEKVYVSPEQITLTPEGVFLFTETGVELVQSVAWDENGLYVTHTTNQLSSDRGTLCGHGYGCRNCGGCISPACWNYCRGCR